jgi:hypothetical protein
MVDCPICAKAVKDARINEHIDSGCQDFLLEAEPQGTPSLGKAYSFFTPGARKPPGATQKNGHPTSSPPPPPAATQLVERSKTPPASSKRPFDEAADAQTNGEPHSPSAPKRARKLKAVADAMPLAERMRPISLDDVYGQELVGPGGVLRGMVDEGRLPSMVLWGRPGTGNASSTSCTLDSRADYLTRQDYNCTPNRQQIRLALRRDQQYKHKARGSAQDLHRSLQRAAADGSKDHRLLRRAASLLKDTARRLPWACRVWHNNPHSSNNREPILQSHLRTALKMSHLYARRPQRRPPGANTRTRNGLRKLHISHP